MESPAVTSLLEDLEDRAAREEEMRQIQSGISALGMDVGERNCAIPAMPVISEQNEKGHRPKLQDHSLFQCAMVARAVGRKEMF